MARGDVPLRDIIAAYLIDRVEAQYSASSGYVTAFHEVAKQIRDGEAESAFAHGEIDDILARLGVKVPPTAEMDLIGAFERLTPQRRAEADRAATIGIITDGDPRREEMLDSLLARVRNEALEEAATEFDGVNKAHASWVRALKGSR